MLHAFFISYPMLTSANGGGAVREPEAQSLHLGTLLRDHTGSAMACEASWNGSALCSSVTISMNWEFA